jgi:UDP-glucose 4-epimerase
MPERVLVTGGAGFVGSHLVELLVDEGFEVWVLDDLSRGHREWLPASCRLHEVDIRDPAGVRRVAEEAEADLVVHLAALHFIPAVDDSPEVAWSINVAGTANLLRALESTPPRRLLFASSAAVYPNLRDPISEATPPGPIDLYGRTKVEGERLTRSFHHETGVECTIARIFNVVGPRETNSHVLEEIVQQLNGGATELQLGDLRPARDFCDVRDVAAALAHLLHAGVPGLSIVNVGSGRAVSIGELVSRCESILGQRVGVVQMEERLRTNDRALLVADTSALRSLGWRPSWTLAATLGELLRERATIPLQASETPP